MQPWEYCEVAWTPKQVTIHVYSSREDGRYEGVQSPEEWGALLTQLGADGWELVGVVPARPASHSLYYFKRAIEWPAQAEWDARKKAREQEGKLREPGTEPIKLTEQSIQGETKPQAS
ncbi:MAG TPA: hypothetical protein VKV20_10355 [Ktedonobacteraceae bacterium]|nr:hypothetical protein [Ktedonobacteraceae bacterium]